VPRKPCKIGTVSKPLKLGIIGVNFKSILPGFLIMSLSWSGLLGIIFFFLLWACRVLNNPNVTVHFNTETVDVEADDKGQMGGLRLRDILTGAERSLKVRGLFYGIGHSPNSQLLEGQIELDDASYVVVEPGTTNTSVEGVYAAGDLQV
jgi:hypothetical protein